jgi:hypothetical protein
MKKPPRTLDEMKSALDERIDYGSGGSAREHWCVEFVERLADREAASLRAKALERQGYRSGALGTIVRFWPKSMQSYHRTQESALRIARIALHGALQEMPDVRARITHFAKSDFLASVEAAMNASPRRKRRKESQ